MLSNRGQNFEQRVLKAIKDNVSDFTTVELDGNRDTDGKTCREVVAAHRRLWEADKKNFPMGKKFWQSVRTTFRSETSPQKMITAVSAEGDIQPVLLQAVVKYKVSGQRAPFISTLQPHINRQQKKQLLLFFRDPPPSIRVRC